MSLRSSCVWLSLPLLALASGADQAPAAPVPEVEFVLPVVREVADHADFTGRTESSAFVQLKARVSGYLNRVLFRDGDRVKTGDLLFEIDPRPYKAEMDKAEAGLILAEARFKKTEAEHKRAIALFGNKVVSREEVDKLATDRDESQARIRVAKAERDHARLNLDFTRITAPFAGRIGRRQLDVGGLARADETNLATLSAEGPIHVSFAIDERRVLGLRRAEGKEGGKSLQVAVGLSDEKGFPRQATAVTLDNRLDPSTATLRARATLANADGLLVPGLSVRVRMTTSKPYKALLVPVGAVWTGRAAGLGRVSMLVLNDKDVPEVREVELGSRHDELVVVKEGLKATDRVVLDGKQPPSTGTKVNPKRVEVPDEKK